MHVHGELEAGPKEHVGSVYIRICGGAFSALELESESLVDSHSEENTDAVKRGINEGFRERMAQREGGCEDCNDFLRESS